MDFNTIFEEEIKQQIREKLQKYTNKVYLDNSDIVEELNISSADNLRRQLYEGKFNIIERCKKSQRHCLNCGLMNANISKTGITCGKKSCPYFRQYKLAEDILNLIQVEVQND